jgi:hypothetical protein
MPPLSAEIMVTQFIILGLAIYRYFTMSRPPRLASGIVALMFRDGLLLIVTVFGMYHLRLKVVS